MSQTFVYAKAAALLRFVRQISGLNAPRPTDENANAYGELLARSKGCSSQYNRCLLESLPPELRLELLLHMPDLSTLQSFVHASPFLYAQYLASDHRILCTCLSRVLDGFFVDAYTTMMTRKKGNSGNILKEYQEWMLEPRTTPELLSAAPSSVRWLAAYHRDIVQPMVNAYSQWAIRNLNSTLLCFKSSIPSLQYSAIKLRRSEEIRIYRAIYRYATFQHLADFFSRLSFGLFGECEVNAAFFSLFDPWEVEAIGCIELFFIAKYNLLCKEVMWDLSYRNPKFLQHNGILRPFDPVTFAECQCLDHDLMRESKKPL